MVYQRPELKDSKSGDLKVLICGGWKKELICGIYRIKMYSFVTALKIWGMSNKD